MMLNPNTDYSFNNKYRSSDDKDLKARLKFYLGIYNYQEGLNTLALSVYQMHIFSIERG